MNRRALLTSAAAIPAAALGTAPASATPAIDADIETPAARLSSTIEALRLRINASDSGDDDPEYLDLLDRHSAAELALGKTPALTLHDMALKIWTMREYTFNSGPLEGATLEDAARIIGPHAVREITAMNAARDRNDQRADEMYAAFGPDLEDLMALPPSQRPAAVRAAGITI